MRTAPAVVAAVVLSLAATHAGRIDAAPYATCFLSTIALSLGLACAGAWRHRGTVGAAGWLIAAALLCALVGNGGYYLDLLLRGRSTWPGWTDLFYLGHYALLLTAALVVLRRRSTKTARNIAALIDAATLATGVAVVAYVFAVADTITDPGVEPLARVLNGVYPLLDVLVLGLAARLLLGAGRPGAALLLAGGMSTQLAGDLLVMIPRVAAATGETRRLLDVLYLVCYLMLGCVLWHRDADRLVTRDARSGEGLGPGRLVLFGTSGLLAPAALLVRSATGGDLHARVIALAAMILFVLTLARMALLVRAVQQQSRQLARQARTDALTGLANRRTFDFELERAMQPAAGAPGAGVAVALIDLDLFKRYNDAHGHGAGDQLLRECAAHWADELASAAAGGVLARYGGEEFAVILRETTLDAAQDVLRRLLARMPTGQTFSAGVARWDGTEDPLTLLRRADELMYRAKAAGRNRVVAQPVAEPEMRLAER